MSQSRLHLGFEQAVNWREAPFLRILFAFMLGIGIAWCSGWGISYSRVVVALGFIQILLAHYLLPKKIQYRWIFGLSMYSFIATIGFFGANEHDELQWSSHFAKDLDSEPHTIICKITEQPIVRSYLRFEADVQCFDGKVKTGRILLTTDSTANTAGLEYGDLLQCEVKVASVKPALNPYSFDARRFYRIKNIHHQGYTLETTIRVIAKRKGNPIWAYSIDCQHKLMQILHEYLPTKDEFAVGSALIVGYRSEIPEDVLNSYIVTGAMHVLSVSGLHVGVLAMLLQWLFGFVKTKNRYWLGFRMIVEVGMIWAFALISGGSSSVLRAALMFSFVIVARTVGSKISVYNTLGASAIVILAWNPYMLFDVGFQLSYLGVLGIVFFYPLIYRQFFFTGYVSDHLWQWLSVGFAAQLVTAPLSIYYFHQFPTYFWLSGLLVVPLSAVVLGIGMLLFSVYGIGFSSLNFLIGKLLWFCIWIMNTCLGAMKQLPYSLMNGIWVDLPILIALYSMLIFFVVLYLTRNIRWGLAIAIVLLLLCINFCWLHYSRTTMPKLTIYSVNKHTLIDIFDHFEIISIRDSSLTERGERFASENNRIYEGIHRPLKKVILEHLEDMTSESALISKQNVICMGRNKIAIVNKYQTAAPIHCDYVLLGAIPVNDLEQVVRTYTPQKIILDSRLSYTKTQEIKIKLKALNQHTIVLSEEGAYTIE